MTGLTLAGMIVFSPWAFGTTQAWAISVMNGAGYFLGLLLVFKHVVRIGLRWQPARWGQEDLLPGSRGCWHTPLLAVITLLVLTYCLVSAVNARSTYLPGTSEFVYHDSLRWLPHSYDSTLSWQVFWNYLALALVFWAARDWLLTKSSRDRDGDGDGQAPLPENERSGHAPRRGYLIPKRLEMLLWVLALNGGLLAAEGLIQHAVGDGRLLWLVEPSMNKTPDAQFGPYAYRSNAAQYFLLAWPATLAFWWLLRARASGNAPLGHGSGSGSHYRYRYLNLLPCIFLMAVVPLISLSRAGAVIGAITLVGALAIIARTEYRSGRRGISRSAIAIGLLLGVVLLIGVAMEWQRLGTRFRLDTWDSYRLQTWKNSLEIVQQNPVFGTGPGTFDSVYHLYRPSTHDMWQSMAHNDWLETLVTFGTVGSAFVLLALGLVSRRWSASDGIPVHRVFFYLMFLSLGSCLVFAAGDFPMQVYSILFLFVIECAVVCSVFPVRKHAGI